MQKIELKPLSAHDSQLAILQYKCDRWLENNRGKAEQMLRMHGGNATSKPDGPVLIRASLQDSAFGLKAKIELYRSIEPIHGECINEISFEMGVFEDTATERHY